jgi:hypothetical protein
LKTIVFQQYDRDSAEFYSKGIIFIIFTIVTNGYQCGNTVTATAGIKEGS